VLKLAESRSNTLFEYDKAVRAEIGVFAGIDEAGRGCLAGDVFAAAVILGDVVLIPDLDDSKKLSAKVRERLFGEITAKAEAYAVAIATVAEINEINILNAALLAMKRAYDGLKRDCKSVLVDGNKSPKLNCKSILVVGGDGKSASIAAASVLAKVSRDKYMEELGKVYPEYGFAKHKGYGTEEHRAAILKYGPCPEHRDKFLRNLNGR